MNGSTVDRVVTTPLPGEGYLAVVAFAVGVFWFLVSDLRLQKLMSQRGFHIEYPSRSIALLHYLIHRPKQDREDLDEAARSVVYALVTLAIGLLLWGRYVTPGS